MSREPVWVKASVVPSRHCGAAPSSKNRKTLKASVGLFPLAASVVERRWPPSSVKSAKTSWQPGRARRAAPPSTARRTANRMSPSMYPRSTGVCAPARPATIPIKRAQKRTPRRHMASCLLEALTAAAEWPPPGHARSPQNVPHALDAEPTPRHDVTASTPMKASGHDVTALLHAWTAGDTDARDQLMAVLYQELRRRAAVRLRRERPGHSLQPTALVHEAYLRLVDQRRVVWQNRGQFFGVASEMMRRILVDHARAHHGEKIRPVGAGDAGREGPSDTAG